MSATMTPITMEEFYGTPPINTPVKGSDFLQVHPYNDRRHRGQKHLASDCVVQWDRPDGDDVFIIVVLNPKTGETRAAIRRTKEALVYTGDEDLLLQALQYWVLATILD